MTGVLYSIHTTVVATISAWCPASVAAAATATEAGTGVGGRGRTGTTIGRIGKKKKRPLQKNPSIRVLWFLSPPLERAKSPPSVERPSL